MKTFVADLNTEIEPIENFIYSGLEDQVSNVFKCTALFAQGTDKKKVFEAAVGSVPYPRATLSINSIDEDAESFNSKALALQRVNVGLSQDGRVVKQVSVLPVLLPITLEYVTKDVRDLSLFANRLHFSRHLGSLNFNVQYGRTVFSVRVLGDGSVPLPQREAELDTVQEYIVTTNLSVRSFISSEIATEIEVISDIEVTGFVGSDERSDEATIKDPTAEFWKFRTSE